MTPAEFRRLLMRGSGRAILYLQANDARPYRPIILQASLHNWAYDRYVDEGRAAYMFDVINLTGEVDFYRDQVLQALTMDTTSRDLQLYELAVLFAKQGYAESRKCLYQAFAQNVVTDFYSADSLIDLDGLDGYVFAAEQIGTLELDEEDEWFYNYLHGIAVERFGEEPTMAALNLASQTNMRIADYVTALQAVKIRGELRFNRKRTKVGQLTYEEFKIAPLNQVEWSTWGEDASEDNVRQAAESLLKITDGPELKKHLAVFRKRVFPLEPDRLMELASHHDRSVRIRAITALSQMRHPAIHDFGVKLMRSHTLARGDCVEVLVNNFVEGDHALIEQYAQLNIGRDGAHSLGFAVTRFYKVHRDPETEIKTLRRLYETDPCAFCREGFVERLLELGALPDWMCAECQWDVNPDIRKLVKEDKQNELA